MTFSPADMANRQAKIANDPLKKQIEKDLGIKLVDPPVKKPFVRKPHLTDRPLKNNTDLRDLRDALAKNEN